jgi:uncharacterized membrane protein YagU involved in acid resistance
MNPQPKTSLLKVILIAGLLAGTLDIIAACVNAYINNPRSTPDKVLQFIASAVFGKKAFAGGNTMAAWGLLFHYIIATGWAVIFIIAYQKMKFLSRNIVLSGLGYGVIVWVLMTRVIVPLTMIKQPPFTWDKAIVAMLILMFFIGLPIALVTKKYYPKLR